MAKKKKGGCPGGVCGMNSQNKYQASANKKIQKTNAKAAVNQAKAESKAQASQPVVSGTPAPAATNPTGMAAINGMGQQGGGLPPLVQQRFDQNSPVTYTQPGPGFWSGTNANISYYPQYEPEQNYVLDQLLRGGLGNLQNLQRPDFEPIAERSQREFATQTVPSLAERFTSLGGGQRSSAFQGALGQAGSDLQSQLAALRSKYGLEANQQQFNQAIPQLQLGLQPRRESVYTPRQSSGISNLFSGFAQNAGQGIGALGKMAFGG
jgi:hypothetical protein